MIVILSIFTGAGALQFRVCEVLLHSLKVGTKKPHSLREPLTEYQFKLILILTEVRNAQPNSGAKMWVRLAGKPFKED
jgi:hypothetical protein